MEQESQQRIEKDAKSRSGLSFVGLPLCCCRARYLVWDCCWLVEAGDAVVST